MAMLVFFSMFGITKCAKASCLLILFHLFVSLHYITSTVLSIVHYLIGVCVCEPLLLHNVFVLNFVYFMPQYMPYTDLLSCVSVYVQTLVLHSALTKGRLWCLKVRTV